MNPDDPYTRGFAEPENEREERRRKANASGDPFEYTMNAMRDVMANNSGLRDGEGTLNKNMGKSKGGEDKIFGSLNEKAIAIINKPDYFKKL